MRVLIDTHVLLWLQREPERLSARVASLLTARETTVLVSAASAWEIAIKVRAGKFQFDNAFLANFDRCLIEMTFEPLHITSAHAIAAGSLAGQHKDPFDRMLAGQAISESLALVSADPHFKLLGVETVW